MLSGDGARMRLRYLISTLVFLARWSSKNEPDRERRQTSEDGIGPQVIHSPPFSTPRRLSFWQAVGMDELDEDLFSADDEHDDDLDDVLAPGCEVRLHLPGIDGLVLSLDTRTGEATGVWSPPQ